MVTINFGPHLYGMTLALNICLVGAKENLSPEVNQCSSAIWPV
jgi:hypothetical protein